MDASPTRPIPTAVPHLLRALADPAAEVRLQAAAALGEFDGPAIAAGLAAALADPERAVAEAAAEGLAALQDPEAAGARCSPPWTTGARSSAARSCAA